MRVGSTRKFSQDRTGFTMVELAVGLAIMGLLIGAILGSIQMVRGAKIKRQASDLEGLEAVVQGYVDRFSQLPGDANSDGYVDADSDVWADLEREGLVRSSKRSPYGAGYLFGADTTSNPVPHRNGNYIRISLPPYAAERIDRQLDDGVNNTGRVTSDSDYGGKARIHLYYFID
jgi:prepilin-type N-terminal cleavage/methylation domain-containing protein